MDRWRRARGVPVRPAVFFTFVLVAILVLVACGQDDSPAGTATPVETAVQQPPATLPPPAMSTTVLETTPSGDPATPTVDVPPLPGDPFPSPAYGVHTFLWWRPEIAQRDIGLVKEMGFHWVKQSFAWRDIESIEKGKYDWWRPDYIVNAVEESGLKMIVRIDRQPYWTQAPDTPPLENAPPADYQDFADFCGVLAGRFQGRIAGYQIWNEPNLSREWGGQPPDPVQYTELLRVCSEAIKAADPEAIVISAGLAPTGTGLPAAIPDDEFLQGMYAAGAGAYFDVLGLNAPGYKAPPETSPEEAAANPEYGGGRWFAFRHVEDMRQVMVENGDEQKQVAILEMGWTLDTVNPAYAWHAVTEEEQAVYLVRAYQYALENWRPWIGLMTTIYIADFDWTPEANEQWWWAITLPDGTPRAAYWALREMAK